MSTRHRAPAQHHLRKVFRWLPGLIGLLAASWLAFSAVTGAQIIVFKTGSMSPTMPPGSAAISLPVTADEITVGDVVTVRRHSDDIPVTHRVVDILHGVDGVQLVLKGDANNSPDPRPYPVTDVLRVLAPVPGLGPALTALHRPELRLTLTLLAAYLVLAAFWPTAAASVGKHRRRRLSPGART